MSKSSIEWTEQTWNPVAGCTWASAGCDHCYAATMTRRLEAMGQAAYAGLTTKKHFNGQIRTLPDKLDVPLRRRKPTMWFVNSMSDLFHKDVPFEFIDQVFAVMAIARQHTFQILTKRPERMADYFTRGRNQYSAVHKFIGPTISTDSDVEKWCKKNKVPRKERERRLEQFFYVEGEYSPPAWPLPNVWLGTSVENQEQADKRIPHLLQTPAAVRFLSCEPLLGAVDLSSTGFEISLGRDLDDPITTNLHWVIVGGESGPGARPMHPDWARGLRDQCVAAGVPFFFKQWGEFIHSSQLPYTLESPAPGQLHYQNKPGEWLQPQIASLVFRSRKADESQFDSRLIRDGKRGVFACVGKKSAGRLLDGREWNEMPEVAAP